MSKFYDEIDDYMEKDLRKIERDLYKAYFDAKESILKQMMDIRTQYDPGPIPYTKLIEEARLMDMYNQIDAEMNALVGVTGEKVFDAIYRGAEYGYLGTTYALEREMGATTGFNMVDTDRIRKLVAMDPSGIPLSSRLYGPMLSKMTGSVKSALLMGLTQGLDNRQMARMLEDAMGVSYNHAKTIVRTESGRMRSLTQQEAFNHAEDLGIKFKKVWVARLDKKTRHSHQDLDGQEVDPQEEFTSPKGYKAPQPRLFGIPSEDINCRCTTISHIDGTKVLKERKDNISKDLVKVKNYKDWLKKYHPDDYAKRYGVAPPKVKVPKPKTPKAKIDEGLFPKELAGVKRGKPMTHEEANSHKPNPNFGKGGGYTINCQTCVVSYEARLRGYDVSALPNTKGSKLEILSRKTNLAWTDPKTKMAPDYIKDDTATSPKKLYDFLSNTLKPNERYTIEFGWKGRGNSGHIISMDLDENGDIRLYDPQSANKYTGQNVLAYFGRMKYTTSLYGNTFPVVPKVLRVDDKEFNLNMVNDILEGTK